MEWRKIGDGACLRHDLAIDDVLLREHEQRQPRLAFLVGPQGSFPWQIPTAEHEMRQDVGVIGYAATRWEAGLNLVSVDRVTRRQNLKRLIAIIMTRFLAFETDGLLQH